MQKSFENLIIVQRVKNSKLRVVPISDKISSEMEVFIFSNENEDEALFTTIKGRKMKQWTLNKLLKKLIKRTDCGNEMTTEELNKIGVYSLRHSIATHLLQNGTKLEQL